jgi:hypothetical protein
MTPCSECGEPFTPADSDAQAFASFCSRGCEQDATARHPLPGECQYCGDTVLDPPQSCPARGDERLCCVPTR